MRNNDMGRKSREYMAQKAAQEATDAVKQVEASTEPVETEQVEQKKENKETRRLEARNEPRDRAMEEIIARREQEAEPEAKEEKKEEAKEEPKNEPKVESTEEIKEEPVVKKMAKVKVDGEEFEVPQEDVDAAGGVAIYQRERAAENRLRKTNEALAETRKVQSQISEWITQNTPKPVVEAPEKFIADRVDLIRFGTPEESAKALGEILAKQNQPVDTGAITAMAVNSIRQDAAINEFKKEFSDIVSNPLLMKFAVTLEDDKRKQLKAIPDWSDFYRSIGNEIRSVIGKPHQPTETPSTSGNTSQPDKEARKASIVSLPTAGSRAALPEATKPETREEILNEMRKSRGLPTG